MFPKIPEDRSTLDAEAKRALAVEIKAAVKAHLATRTPDTARQVVTEANEQLALADGLIAEAEADELATVLDEPEVEEVETTEATDAPDDGDDEDEDDEDDDETTAEVEEETEVTAATTPARRGRQGVPARQAPAREPLVTVGQFAATDKVAGMKTGEAFTSSRQLAEAVQTLASSISPSSDTKHYAAVAKGNFAPEMILGEDYLANLERFEKTSEQMVELVAAMCAPAVPNYNLGCMNSTRRPVRNSMPAFAAPRGAVTIYPSPTLEDITTGVGQWTSTDDANASAVKEDCATITCATPVEYRIYGVYRCITIKNLLQMTFPELVDAYLNRLSAAHSRLGDTLLLEAMAAGTDTVSVEPSGAGGTVSILRALLQYRTAHDELQRWDTGNLEVWLHRSVVNAIKADVVSRRNTSGSTPSVPSDAQVSAIFRDAGFNLHPFIDTPSWVTAQPQFAANGATGRLRGFPRNVEMLIAPPGKFAVMDRGELNIGVTGNGMYRDNESNRRNQFTFFFENFEGVVDTDSCPAHILEIDNVCWNGSQVADTVVDCEGQDEPGIGS